VESKNKKCPQRLIDTELTEMTWCSAVDSFEDQKTELVPNLLRHVQPIKSIVQQTRYRVPTIFWY